MRTARLETVKSIIENENIATQQQLQKSAAGRGLKVTQATLSRDMAALGVIKKDGRYIIPPVKEIPPLIKESVREIDRAVNTVVFKCRAGTANAACAAFDSLDMPGVVGTIAGDDTIFILMRTSKEAAAFEKLIRGLMER
ncbi:MAG: ArgR family transcriptional regulator [Ruminococcus sp.]|nr:ArgR family transcriptional regulator [Ruminococcus sp.]